MEEGDVILMIENVPVQCKKKVLIAHSDYFKVMFEGNFAERDKSIVTLEDIDLKSMNLILVLIWDHTYMINDEDIMSVLQASCMLQFDNIRENCIRRLAEKLNPSNCINIWFVCESLGLRPLYLKAKNLALIEFTVIRETDALLQLDVNQLHMYLGNVLLQCNSELDVFNACMHWYYENGDKDDETLLNLLHCIDFNRASELEIREMRTFPDIYDNKKLSVVLRLTIALKQNCRDIQFVNEDDRLVAIARKWLNSKMRNRTNMDPVFFITNDTILAHNDAGSNVQLCFDSYRLKRKYMRFDGGGNQKDSTASLIIYDIKRNKFVKCLDIPSEKYLGYEGFHIVGYKEKIFMFGGEVTLGSGHWNLNFWVYDTIRERWERITRLPSGRRHFHSVICGPYLYIIGGTGAFRIIQDNMYWYNYKENIWSCQLILPCPARQIKCCNHNEQLFLLNMNNKCGYLLAIKMNNFVKLDFLDERQLIAAYPDQFTLFSYNGKIYIKSSTLIEFQVEIDTLRVTNVWNLNCCRDAMSSDTMESIVCNETVLTMYKCTQTETVNVELLSMETHDVHKLPEHDAWHFNVFTKLFALQHHYKMVEDDTYVNEFKRKA